MIGQEEWFYFAGGRTARSIEELAQILDEMDSSEFFFHVNNGKNDFANWVEGVFGEHTLAKDMRDLSDREGLLVLVRAYLKDVQDEKSEEASLDSREGEGRESEEHEKHEFLSSPKKTFVAIEVPQEADFGENLLSKLEVPQGAKRPVSSIVVDEPEPIRSASFVRAEGQGVIEPVKGSVDESDDEPEKPSESISKEDKDVDLAEMTLNLKKEMENYHMGEKGGSQKADAKSSKDDNDYRFIVKEFIYGFVMGLVFGLIMLGVLFNLRC